MCACQVRRAWSCCSRFCNLRGLVNKLAETHTVPARIRYLMDPFEFRSNLRASVRHSCMDSGRPVWRTQRQNAS